MIGIETLSLESILMIQWIRNCINLLKLKQEEKDYLLSLKFDLSIELLLYRCNVRSRCSMTLLNIFKNDLSNTAIVQPWQR